MLLIRDAPELQVFMLRRNLQSVFAAGAYVFPGGAVDPDDDDPALLGASETVGAAAAVVPARFRVAAIREAFEEAGVLLARDAATGQPVDVASLSPAREALERGDRTFTEVVADLGVVLDTGSLWPIGRFITPRGAPRRFDTWFFVAPAPDGHAYRHDAGETVASLWIRPEDALERGRGGEFELIEPTWCTLGLAAQYPRAAPFFDAVRAGWDAASPLEERYRDRGWLLRVGDTPDLDERPQPRKTTA
ncbi:MAG TPA: NUDIX hydrolase [Acidimicrobiia bacterium]|nr:NUDIX hydrolase [Acidimicrobiia bacterium]